jgi:hypothetical protein
MIVNESGCLICQECGHDIIHQRIVVVNVRRCEDGEHLRASIASGGCVDVRLGVGSPHGRRDDVSITFECEGCGAMSRLNLTQHKGPTVIRWLSQDESV